MQFEFLPEPRSWPRTIASASKKRLTFRSVLERLLMYSDPGSRSMSPSPLLAVYGRERVVRWGWHAEGSGRGKHTTLSRVSKRCGRPLHIVCSRMCTQRMRSLPKRSLRCAMRSSKGLCPMLGMSKIWYVTLNFQASGLLCARTMETQSWKPPRVVKSSPSSVIYRAHPH